MGGTVNLFSGPFATGKTALLASLSAALRDGQEVFGLKPPRPVKQAIISADRSWQGSTKLWFDQAGFPDIPHYSLQDDLSFNIERLRHKPQRIKILHECLDRAQVGPDTLVYVDPIAPFLGGNLLDYDTCLVHCSLIRRMCLDRQITIVGLAHAPKIKNDPKEGYVRPIDRIYGTVAQGGYTDAQLVLTGPDELREPYYLFVMHSHHMPIKSYMLTRDAWGLFIPWAEGVSVREDDPIESAVLALFKKDPLEVQYIVSSLSQYSRRTLFRTLNTLVESGRLERAGRGKYRVRKPS